MQAQARWVKAQVRKLQFLEITTKQEYKIIAMVARLLD